MKNTKRLDFDHILTFGCASDESWPAPFRGSPGGASPFKAAACKRNLKTHEYK